MEVDPKDLAAFFELVLHHERMLQGAAEMIHSQAVLVKVAVPKCFFCGHEPATVKKGTFIACERCAAERIVRTRGSEADWADLPYAEAVRSVNHFVDLVDEAKPDGRVIQ